MKCLGENFALIFICLQGNSGGVLKSLSDITSSNYWVVKDYNRLVNLVNSLEPAIQRLSDDQVSGFRFFISLLEKMEVGV